MAGKSRGKGGKRRHRGRGKKRAKGLLDYSLMQALGSEPRVRIFAIFCERIASPNEIATELGEGLSQVSYHVKILHKCGLIVLDQKVPRRGAVEHFYRSSSPTLIPPGTWDRLPAAVRKSISLDILQEFHEDAADSMEAGLFDDPPGELSWTPLVLDARGLEELGRLSSDFLEKVLALQADANKRMRKQGESAKKTSATVFLASFLSTRSPEEGKRAAASKRR